MATLSAYLADEGLEQPLAEELARRGVSVTCWHGRLALTEAPPVSSAWALDVWDRPQEIAAPSVKAAADVYMPIAGEVLAVNEDLRGDPSLANKDPLATGWFFRIRIAEQADFDALMDEAAYAEFVKDNA